MLKITKHICLILVFLCVQSCKNTEQDREDDTQKAAKAQKRSNASIYNTQLGIAYLRQGNTARAKVKLLNAMKYEPKSPDVNAAMAYFYEQTHDFENAKKYYLKAISFAPNSGAQMNNYGAFLCGQKDYKNAEVYFLKATEDKQYINTASAFENAGLCAISAMDYKNAEKYLTRALQHDPSKKVAFYELLKMKIKEKQESESIALLVKYPLIVTSDQSILRLAKNIARNAQRTDLEAFYIANLQKNEQNVHNSGVMNEYSNA